MYKGLTKFLLQSKRHIYIYIYVINIIRKINKGFRVKVAAEMTLEG